MKIHTLAQVHIEGYGWLAPAEIEEGDDICMGREVILDNVRWEVISAEARFTGGLGRYRAAVVWRPGEALGVEPAKVEDEIAALQVETERLAGTILAMMKTDGALEKAIDQLEARVKALEIRTANPTIDPLFPKFARPCYRQDGSIEDCDRYVRSTCDFKRPDWGNCTRGGNRPLATPPVSPGGLPGEEPETKDSAEEKLDELVDAHNEVLRFLAEETKRIRATYALPVRVVGVDLEEERKSRLAERAEDFDFVSTEKLRESLATPEPEDDGVKS
jgi:hypothetical protein